MTLSRVDIHYKGTVQGVGFRYTVRRIASRFAVTGFVRNLKDGQVHLVVEGEKGEIDHLLNAVDDSLGGYVCDREMTQSVSSGEFASFDIRS